MEIKALTYIDILKFSKSFFSLDISVSGTGWAKWEDGNLTYGVYSIETPKDDSLGRRKEFRTFLRATMGSTHYETIFVEDVIGSINFETANILYQLNPIVDDMVDDGVLFADKIRREGNKEWKKSLKLCAGYNSTIRGMNDDKKMIRESLLLLGFGDGTTNEIPQDVYDAVGMAVGTLFSTHVLGATPKKKVKLKSNISVGYQIKQYDTHEKALKAAEKKNRAIHEVDYTESKGNFKNNFKKYIEELGSDTGVFLICIETNRLGALALDKNLDLDYPISYLLAFRNLPKKK